MKLPHLLPLALALLGSTGVARADDAAILGCRKLADAGARLACYDAIPATAAVGGIAAAAPAAAPVPAAAAAAAAPEQSFGLENVRRPEAPKRIESTLAGDFEGWGPNTRFTLANGQVWKVVDGSSETLPRVSKPKVRIVRNLFGTMFMEFDGINSSPKVRRVQ
ncbi:hypothetical protein [uncultured Massilia sp.]|uniref:hypothetical protein n=1 Tax=uncultured Massilia sp. TaxID=169973 RepID=UPI0025DD17D1|nr:hypothetical protein [uncultured Massilia sp.]